jgi:hypothetical protein
MFKYINALLLGVFSYSSIMLFMAYLLGLGILAIGLLVDAFKQVRRFASGDFLDSEIREMAGLAILKFTIGFAMAIGLYYYFKYLHFFDQ